MGNMCCPGSKKTGGAGDVPKLDDKELKAIFDEFDVNGDGHIQRAELRNVMQKMGQSPTDEELMAMFAAADADKDGAIDFEEFRKIAVANPIGLSLRQVFDEMDVDGDGHLSRSEMRTAFAKLGHQLNDKQLKTIYDQVDLDSDGKISFDEFVLMMTKNPNVGKP